MTNDRKKRGPAVTGELWGRRVVGGEDGSKETRAVTSEDMFLFGHEFFSPLAGRAASITSRIA